MDSVRSVEHVATAVQSGACHIGKEGTVVVIGAFGNEGYKPRPLTISPTCKKEDVITGMGWIGMVEEQWHSSPSGEARYGPIWSIASDGDPTHRNILHRLTCITALSQSDPLYCELGTLAGFNLLVGKRNLTSEYDPRHLIKRRTLSSWYMFYTDPFITRFSW